MRRINPQDPEGVREPTPILAPALLLLVTVVLTLVVPPGAISSAPPGPPAAVLVEAFTAVPQAAHPPRTAALVREMEAGLQDLARARQATREEREQLRRLGRRMHAVLGERQAAWIVTHRNDVSLDRFEKPYWVRLQARLQP